MRNYILLFLFVLVLSTGCERLPDIQGRGAESLQGVWEQDSISSEIENYTKHKFRFSCDSFYVELQVNNRINYFTDTCSTNGKRVEFAKGIYALKGDSLFLSGTYTKENYKQKISGCYNIGSYKHNFLITESANGRMSMRDLSNNQECIFKQTEKYVCEPKPL